MIKTEPWYSITEGKIRVRDTLVNSVQPPVLEPDIVKAVSGDRAAAERILTEILPRVGNLVRYLVGNDAEVEDISQKALIEILKSMGSFRGESKFTTWADRITIRVALSHVKRRRIEHNRKQEISSRFSLMHDNRSEQDLHMLRRKAVEVLDHLPSEQREILVLHHVAGLSVPELSEILEIPFETVRSRLRLGIKKLRDRFEGEGGLK